MQIMSGDEIKLSVLLNLTMQLDQSDKTIRDAETVLGSNSSNIQSSLVSLSLSLPTFTLTLVCFISDMLQKHI